MADSAEDSELNIQDLNPSDDDRPATRTLTASRRQHSPVDKDARDAALRSELASVQQVNNVIEGVIDSLEKAKANMETVSSTVNSANTLLNLWVRILSQTEHTQRLLLSGHWQGATKDLNDIEAEALAQTRENERRKEEERNRAAAREREKAAVAAARDAAESKAAATSGRGGSSRGRVRGKVVGGSSAVSGSRVPPPASSSGSGASGSGTGPTRGRGLPRGVGRTGRMGGGIGRGRGVK